LVDLLSGTTKEQEREGKKKKFSHNGTTIGLKF
jgi:hypothetical protein